MSDPIDREPRCSGGGRAKGGASSRYLSRFGGLGGSTETTTSARSASTESRPP